MATVIVAMATVVLYIVVKVYWDSSTIFSSYHELNINIPGTPPGWFRDQAAYIVFNFSSQGRVTISHDPPEDGHRGLEHHDESHHTSGFRPAGQPNFYPSSGLDSNCRHPSTAHRFLKILQASVQQVLLLLLTVMPIAH